MGKPLFVTVLLDSGLQKPLDYKVPPSISHQILPGMRVEVPLRSQSVLGTILEVQDRPSFPNPKPLLRLLSEESFLTKAQWKLALWMEEYYATPLSKVLKLFLPPHVKNDTKPLQKTYLSLALSEEKAKELCSELRSSSKEQSEILDFFLQKGKRHPLSFLLQELPFSKSPFDSLVKKKALTLEKVSTSDDFFLEEEFFPTLPRTLLPGQAACLSSIETSLQKGIYQTHLLHGITGSGKTEIYLQAMQSALDKGKSSLLLIPEVSLTSQTIERLKSRFSQKIAILHHKRSLGERNQAWKEIQKGEIQLIVGARSALFAPIQNLQLLIVDEEHDSSYKQTDEMPCYHARDVAVMRGFLENATVLLGSATPSIESRYNASTGKYSLHTLQERATKASLPTIHIVDQNVERERRKGFSHFSESLLQALQKRVEKGEQALFFLNKRGYHRLQTCPQCHHTLQCPHCNLSLPYHKKEGLLRCHLCHYSRPPSTTCTQCQEQTPLQFRGFGTEHVEASLHALFPSIRTLRMDKDTTTRSTSHEEIFEKFRSHKADVLIGTQMIAKGLHFPSVTLVGILDIDSALLLPDFRSPERVFQLLVQVAGRAGRAELPGEVFLQTSLPSHPIIRFAQEQNFEKFYEATLEDRRLFGYPPFSHLIKCIAKSPIEEEAKEQAEIAHKELSTLASPDVEVLPISPAGHPKVQDQYRFQFIIRTKKVSYIKTKIEFLQRNKIKIDIDTNSVFF